MSPNSRPITGQASAGNRSPWRRGRGHFIAGPINRYRKWSFFAQKTFSVRSWPASKTTTAVWIHCCRNQRATDAVGRRMGFWRRFSSRRCWRERLRHPVNRKRQFVRKNEFQSIWQIRNVTQRQLKRRYAPWETHPVDCIVYSCVIKLESVGPLRTPLRKYT